MTDPRVAVVTGGGSGIGRAIAERLAAEGHAVGVLDLDEGAAVAAAGEIAEIAAAGSDARSTAGIGPVVGVPTDVADPDQVQAAVEEVRGRLGPVAVLVNAAGTGSTYRRFLDLTTEDWHRVLEVNLTGAFHCCRAALPDMIEHRWGRIVNISSSSTHGGQPFMSPYVSSKSGLNGLTKCLALEFGSKGVTVNAITPGFIDTPMLRASESRGEFGPGGVEEAITRTPVRRIGHPEDVAATCAFLCSDGAAYLTGQVIGVNGGRNT